MGQIQVTKLEIPGLCIIEPKVHGDARGYFMEKLQPWDVKFKSIKDVPRDMYDYVFDEIAISGTGVRADATIIHELMHVMEYRKPEIIDLERQF